MDILIVVLMLVAYVLIGTFMSFVVDGEDISFLSIVFWPLIIVFIIIFKVLEIIKKAGLYVHEKVWDKI